MDGKWEEIDVDSTNNALSLVKHVGLYKLDKKCGKWEAKNENGKTISYGHYNNGNQDGHWYEIEIKRLGLETL